MGLRVEGAVAPLEVTRMATAAQRDERRVPKGAVIFRQGDPGNEMFVISEGRVRLTLGSDGHEKEIAMLGPGEFFGELSLLSEDPRSATAVAAEDTALLAIGRDVFAMMVQDDLDIVFRMMNIQGRRLSNTNQPIQELVQRLGHISVAAHCLRQVLKSGTSYPFTLDVAALATELQLNPQAVAATVADLVRFGAGSLQDNQWQFGSRDHVDKLVDALCTYAARRA